MENYKHIIIEKIYFSEKHLFIGTFTYALPYNVYRTSKSLYVEYFWSGTHYTEARIMCTGPEIFYITGTLV